MASNRKKGHSRLLNSIRISLVYISLTLLFCLVRIFPRLRMYRLFLFNFLEKFCSMRLLNIENEQIYNDNCLLLCGRNFSMKFKG